MKVNEIFSPQDNKCETCHGTGLITRHDYDGIGGDADDQPCPNCKGMGHYGEEQEEDEDEICGSCNGSGEGRYEGTRCQSCKGSGVVNKSDPDDDYHPGMEHDYGRE